MFCFHSERRKRRGEGKKRGTDRREETKQYSRTMTAIVTTLIIINPVIMQICLFID